MEQLYNIDTYRSSVIEELKRTNNHYDTQIVNLTVDSYKFNYHRWLHPYQGHWEVNSVFSSTYLNNLSKILDKDSIVLDIGAQTGYMSVAYALLAKHVYSFEPNPAAFEVLQLNSQLHDNITPFNLAITETEGPLEFHYSDTGFCNGGFASNTKFGVGVTGHIVPIDVYGVNLLSFIDQQDIKMDNLKLIKIDAEGYDKNILRSITLSQSTFIWYFLLENVLFSIVNASTSRGFPPVSVPIGSMKVK